MCLLLQKAVKRRPTKIRDQPSSWRGESWGPEFTLRLFGVMPEEKEENFWSHSEALCVFRRRDGGGRKAEGKRKRSQRVCTFSTVALSHVHSRKSRPQSSIHEMNSNDFLTKMELFRLCKHVCVRLGGVGCRRMGDRIPEGAEGRKIECWIVTMTHYPGTHTYVPTTHKDREKLWRRCKWRLLQGEPI